MTRAVRLFFALLTGALALFAAAAWITFERSGPNDWSVALVRFLILGGGIGCSLAAWGSAVSIAYVHRVTWPFWVMTGLVVTAGLGFAVVCYRIA